MMKYLFAMMAFFAWGSHAMAAEVVPAECRFITAHKPSADVAYKEGVDVKGRPVVPADLNADPMGIKSQTIIMPLTVDFAQRLQTLNIAGLNTEGTLGFLEISPDGRVTYNGQDLTQPMQALCAPKPPESGAPANGQTPPDTVEYAPPKQ